MSSINPSDRYATSDIYDRTIEKLRKQVWLGLMLITLFNLVSGRWIRARGGYESPTPLGMTLLVVFYIILIGGVLFRNSDYIYILQTIFIFAVHAVVPIIMLFFGGTQGNGDILLFVAILLNLLYGFKWWMWLTYAASIGSYIFVLYLEFLGQPIAPLVEDTSQIFVVKSILFITISAFALYVGNRFYTQLIASYRQFGNEQIEINNKLQLQASQRRKLAEELKRSRLKTVAAREEERRRLRRDLHDGLGPTLAAQVLRVGAARNLLEKDPIKATNYLEDLNTGIGDILVDVKQLIDELRPPILDRIGLLSAIKHQLSEIELPIMLHLNLPKEIRQIDGEIEVAVWRIFQTGLDNVIRHAEAKNCSVTIETDEKRIYFKMVDDGDGLPAEYREGVGITSMRERITSLNGRIDITNANPGTQLKIELPLNIQENKDGS